MILNPRRALIYSTILGLGGCYHLLPFQLGFVVGRSMSPSLKSGEPYLLDRASYEHQPVQRGDVVVFDLNGTTYVKRVLAVGGDTVLVLRRRGDFDEQVVMDWALPDSEKISQNPYFQLRVKLVRREIPSGYCYVLGDNYNNSMDSRVYGPVPIDNIRGRVLTSPGPTAQFRHAALIFQQSRRS